MSERRRATAADAFEPHRRRLAGLAYRMLGSVADAEDVVQEAWLRWQAADRAGVAEPRAYLSRVVTRLCLDQIKSARARRETYVGPWLPEPVLDEAALGADEAAVDLSVALMLALERLSPLERAAFLMHDIFEASFEEVGRAIGRTPATCRQLAARARDHVRGAQPRFPVSAEEGDRIVRAFREASAKGDAAVLSGLLADDVVFRGDGGGKRTATMNPVFGRDRVLRLILGLSRKRIGPSRYRYARINGLPGYISDGNDDIVQTTALEIADGRIAAIHVVRNPDKLRQIPPLD